MDRNSDCTEPYYGGGTGREPSLLENGGTEQSTPGSGGEKPKPATIAKYRFPNCSRGFGSCSQGIASRRFFTKHRSTESISIINRDSEANMITFTTDRLGLFAIAGRTAQVTEFPPALLAAGLLGIVLLLFLLRKIRRREN